MIARVFSAAVALAGLALACVPFACSRTPSISDGPVDAIDSLFTAFDRDGMPGAAVVVIR